jgi:hypothetical protein
MMPALRPQDPPVPADSSTRVRKSPREGKTKVIRFEPRPPRIAPVGVEGAEIDHGFA